MWPLAYYVIVSLEMSYGKFMVRPALKLNSAWTPVMYTNGLSIFPMLVLGYCTGEFENISFFKCTFENMGWPLSSCAVGVTLSFFGWRFRSMISATGFAVIGLANKVVTELANIIIWREYVSLLGITALLSCLVAATMYQQAPHRADHPLV